MLFAIAFSGAAAVGISYTTAWCIRATSSTTYRSVHTRAVRISIIDAMLQHGRCVEQATGCCIGYDLLWRRRHVRVGICGQCRVLRRFGVRGGEEQPEESGGGGATARGDTVGEQVVVILIRTVVDTGEIHAECAYVRFLSWFERREASKDSPQDLALLV